MSWRALRFAVPVALLVAASSLGCATPHSTRPAVNSAALLADARAAGLILDDPLVLDPAIEESIERSVGRDGNAEERLHRLTLYLNHHAFGFAYERGTTLSAREAFQRRRGDCLTYAILYVALSRFLGIDTYFVHVREVESYYDRNDALYASSHLAVAYGPGPNPLVMDIANELTTWRMSTYAPIDDASAVALYHNNLAVDALLNGDAARAESTLAFLVDQRPGLAELHNNYAVTLLRQRRPREALSALERALALFPRYTPLYTNAIQAAQRADMPELARSYEAQGAEIQQGDPLFLVARGIRMYRRAEYQAAVAQFDKARDLVPDSFVVNAWLARAHLSAGNEKEGREVFHRVQQNRPEDARVRELERQFPELRRAEDR